jgi:polar amino acid transport system substrate-binding protein
VQVNPTPATATSAAPAPPCNPRQSLRPPATLPPPGQMEGGTTMRAIQDRGRLVAGVDQNTYLFGFRNPSTNRLEGFDIDRVREIALAIFGGPTDQIDSKIQFKVITSANRVPALEAGDVDVVVRTFTANCDRWSKINFSAIYYVAGQQLLVENGSPIDGFDKIGGKRVCAQAGSTSIANLAKLNDKPVPVVNTTWSDCLVMLQQGQVDAVSTDDTILTGMAKQDPNLKLVGTRLTDEPYGIGIPKKNEDMVRFVNGVLEKSVKGGDWATSYRTWLGGTDPPPPREYR